MDGDLFDVTSALSAEHQAELLEIPVTRFAKPELTRGLSF